MPFYERQPHIQPLHALIAEAMKGEIRVPKFQRPGTEVTWDSKRRGDLLDSIYRGFPVGTILLWSTQEKIETIPAIGGFAVPPLPDSDVAPKRLLLDGHQRLSTLVQILGAGLSRDLGLENINISPEITTNTLEVWVFELKANKETGDLVRDRFLLLKKGQQPNKTQLPLSIVLSRTELNHWIRERNLSDAQTQLADGLRDRLREYAMPVAVLVTDSLSEATESFKRINSSGTKMGDFHMVSALAYQMDFDPQMAFSEAREEHLVPIGWEEVDDIHILRVCAGLARMPPASYEIGRFARKLRDEPSLIKDAFLLIARAAEKLASVGILGPRSLPYTWQLITLSIRGSEIDKLNRTDQDKSDAIERWFWLTTYGGVFSGVKSAVYDRASKALISMILGGAYQPMKRDMSLMLGEVTRFDFRTARARACALAMARFQDRDQEEAPSFRALAYGAQSLQTLHPRGKRSDWWNLVIVTPQTGVRECRDALRRRADGQAVESGDDALLSRIGISEDSRGCIEEILEDRRRKLADEEKRFVEELGLIWE